MFLLTACNNANESSSPKQTGKTNIKTTPVEVTTAQLGTAASYYLTTATIEPSSDAKINARASGVVRQILREEGDNVKAGDILLLLEDDDQKLRLKQAEQKLSSSRREFLRLNKMSKAGAVATNEWEAANNNFLAAQTELELAQLALSYTKVAAPFNGRVVWREVDLGAHVTTGNLLFRIMAINPLLIRVHIPANRIGQVAKGQSVELNVDSAKEKLKGIVELVSPIVDPASGTIKVTIQLNQYPDSVRPGDFTEVKVITDKRENAMLLPSVAIIEERNQHYLYVEENNKAVRKNIEVGYVIAEQTEILSGITAEDRVVIKGQRNLNEGNHLKVISSDKTTSPSDDKVNSDISDAGKSKEQA